MGYSHFWLQIRLHSQNWNVKQYNQKIYCVCFRSHAIVETADGDTIVCYHPSEPFPYEHTKVCGVLNNSALSPYLSISFVV